MQARLLLGLRVLHLVRMPSLGSSKVPATRCVVRLHGVSSPFSKCRIGSALGRRCRLNQTPWKLTAQLLLAASTIALFGTPVFIWLCYPRPSLAYEFGAAWNILTGLLVVGLAAALLSDFFVRRQGRRGATQKARFAASASGPAIVLAPSLAVAGLTTGSACAAFVFLVSAVATVVFWLLTRRSRGCTLCRPGCRSM